MIWGSFMLPFFLFQKKLYLCIFKVKKMKIGTKRIILLCCGLLFFAMQKSMAVSFAENDTILIPCNDLYQNSWGGVNTRLKTNILNKTQEYILPLQVDSNEFVFPTVRKTHVCSPYGMRSGRMHTGMDIKQSPGDSIVAAWDGVVRMANKNYYAYGGTVVIRHHNGLETLYAHLSKIYVLENQTVKAGELIGLAGRTGRATTEHLHFETRSLYEYFDPRTIIDFNTFSLKTDTLYIVKGKFSSNLLENIPENTDEQLSDSEIVADNSQEENDPSIQEKTNTNTIISPQTEFYIVKKGDTLYSISKKYNVSINVLCRINNITQESVLQIGQKLKLRTN